MENPVRDCEIAADVVKDIREEQITLLQPESSISKVRASIRHSAEEIRKIAGETRHLSQQKEDILGNIGSLRAISEEKCKQQPAGKCKH